MTKIGQHHLYTAFGTKCRTRQFSLPLTVTLRRDPDVFDDEDDIVLLEMNQKRRVGDC